MPSIVLYAPEIPGNTGSIGRTCLALGYRLILIEPIAFDLSEKAVRRAGLDYWKHVDLIKYGSFEEFINKENVDPEKLFYLSKTAQKTIFETTFDQNSYLVFGSETKGLPPKLMQKYKKRLFSLPMVSDKVRSLNLSNAATTVAYEVYRQINY